MAVFMDTSMAAAMRNKAKMVPCGVMAGVLAVSWCGLAASNVGTSVRGQPPIEMPFLKDPGAANRLISLDFNQADIRIFIKTVGQLTGINFLVDDKIQGTVTLISPSKIRLGEVYSVFESVLQT
jgi:type II secretory pathway component GspD/PulD (secretin)